MIESPPRVNNWDKFDGGTRFSKRKPAPQPGDSGYGILTSLSFVFFYNYFINYDFILYLHAISYKPYLNIHLAPRQLIHEIANK